MFSSGYIPIIKAGMIKANIGARIRRKRVTEPALRYVHREKHATLVNFVAAAFWSEPAMEQSSHMNFYNVLSSPHASQPGNFDAYREVSA